MYYFIFYIFSRAGGREMLSSGQPIFTPQFKEKMFILNVIWNEKKIEVSF